MLVFVQCPDPDCQAPLSIVEGETSRFWRCPQCGREFSRFVIPELTSAGSADSPEPRSVSGSPAFWGLAPGATFAGRYEIVRQLGRGGMGVVYLARDTRLERQVALKLPFLWGDGDPEFLHRFYREARAAATLEHPNICPVFDVDNHDGQPYLTMEYLEGVLLSDHLKARSKPMEPGNAIRLVRKLAQVIKVAHQQGIVHRDLKPANIMLDLKAGPMVMDFGLSRREGREESLHTQTGQHLGTPAYMPLEQFQGNVEKLGPRSDIYSLGVILFELLTGKRPYEGNAFEIHMRLLSSVPPAPSSFRPELEPALDWICQKAMAREIDDRYASMSEFDHALRAIASKDSGHASKESGQVSPVKGGYEENRVPDAGMGPARPAGRSSAGSAQRPELAEADPPEDPVPWWALYVPAWTIAAVAGVPVLILGLFLWARSHDGPNNQRPLSDKPRTFAPGKAAVATGPVPWAPGNVKNFRPVPPANFGARLQPGWQLSKPVPQSPLVPPGALFAASPKAPALKPAAPPRQVTSPSTGMVLVRIEPGDFMMGSPDSDRDANTDEKPAHRVRITRPFYVGKYEVTQAEYQTLIRANPSLFAGSERQPVDSVSWLDAVRFCNRLSRREGLKSFYEISDAGVRVPDWNAPGYRLPTEAEWEYACRAKATTRFSFGDDDSSLVRYAWFHGNASDKTHEVGRKRANGFGLHDMQGNVWEWCWDWWDGEYYKKSPVNDPRGPSQSSDRVLRGGGWTISRRLCRSASRYRSPPDHLSHSMGFRVARGEAGQTSRAAIDRPALEAAAASSKRLNKSPANAAAPPPPSPVDVTTRKAR